MKRRGRSQVKMIAGPRNQINEQTPLHTPRGFLRSNAPENLTRFPETARLPRNPKARAQLTCVAPSLRDAPGTLNRACPHQAPDHPGKDAEASKPSPRNSCPAQRSSGASGQDASNARCALAPEIQKPQAQGSSGASSKAEDPTSSKAKIDRKIDPQSSP